MHRLIEGDANAFLGRLRQLRCDPEGGRAWIALHGGTPCGNARQESWRVEFPRVELTCFLRAGPWPWPEWQYVVRTEPGCPPSLLPWECVRDAVIAGIEARHVPEGGWGLSRGPGTT
jgi:hypothetical protein